MELYSLDIKFKNETLERKKELAETDSYNAMRAFLAGRISLDEFEKILDQLSQKKLLIKLEVRKMLLERVMYEGRLLSIGLKKDKDEILKRVQEFVSHFKNSRDN